ncbi:hypothetical protein COU54_02240 [Candidatus Pacearchaeota archaeon CG10_big_fil_rev_8_21_14_0_10_31_24]|nr:MAG: hypothetical protein COU54_02240 [Candidatus Pacearchaeota archaeon CG10_big_fil_rev_8_21_14_0_10_31_24]
MYFPTSQDFNSCPAFSDATKININETRAYYDEVNGSNKLVVFYHGNGGSACDRAFLLEVFREENSSSIFVEYSGYSNESKRPTKKRILQNIENTDNFISTLDYSELTLIGESLGTGLVSEHISINKPEKVILISPYTSTLDIAKYHYPFIPATLILRERYDTHKIKEYDKKLLIIVGEEDKTIPSIFSKEVFENAKTKNKEFVSISNADHNHIYQNKTTLDEIGDFLKS